MSRTRLAGTIASAALLFIALALAILGGQESNSERSAGESVRLADGAALEELSEQLGHPLYWVGAKPQAEIELREDAAGNVYLRYLPPGVEAGDPRQSFLTVGTYPVQGAQAALGRTAKGAGAELKRLPGGTVVLPNPTSSGSVYLAYPHSDLEVEVYDPRPGKALELIRSGAVRPVAE